MDDADYDEEEDNDSVPVGDKSQSSKAEAKEINQTDDEFNKILNSEMEKEKVAVALKQEKAKLEIKTSINKDANDDVEDALNLAFNNEKKGPSAPKASSRA